MKKRVKMDPNRGPMYSCANFSDDAHIAYDDYHTLIEKHFKLDFVLNSSNPRRYAQGLIIDLHGHSHAEDWIELGYCMTRADLNRKSLATIAHLDRNYDGSSVDSLVARSRLNMNEIIRGEDVSLGGLLESRFGLNAVPSPRHPHPLAANYYSGGYITEAHGSRGASPDYPFSAIQIEVPASLRADETVDLFAKKLAACLFEFYHIHGFDAKL